MLTAKQIAAAIVFHHPAMPFGLDGADLSQDVADAIYDLWRQARRCEARSRQSALIDHDVGAWRQSYRWADRCERTLIDLDLL